MVALAAVCSGALVSGPKSSNDNNNNMPNVWAASFVIAYNLASALENATIACVLDHFLRQC